MPRVIFFFIFEQFNVVTFIINYHYHSNEFHCFQHKFYSMISKHHDFNKKILNI